MKKRLLIIITLGFMGLYCISSQPNFSNPILHGCCPVAKKHMDSIINNSPFAFEGRMIETELKMHESKTGTYYLSHLFEIEKVYRGGEKLKAGTVEIISPIANSPSDLFSHAQFGYDWHVIFCKETNIKGVYNSLNETKFELFYSYNEYFSYITENSRSNKDGEPKTSNPYFSGLSIKFETKLEIRQFLKTYALHPRNPDKAPQLKSSEEKPIELSRSPFYKTKKEVKEYKKYLKRKKIMLDSISNSNLKKREL